MSLGSLLSGSSASGVIRGLHETCLLVAARKYMLTTGGGFYAEFASIMERCLENRTGRPCLLCCDLVAAELLACPQPAKAATATVRATPATEAGSLFALLFRGASFPPAFRASVAMLPLPLQRMIHHLPAHQLPAWFRARLPVTMDQQQLLQQQQQRAAGGSVAEYLDVSLYEYFFLSLASFLLQPDIQVQGIAAAPQVKVTPPPTPDQYNEAFRKLLENYLHFFVPLRGVHSTSMRLEETGWSVPTVLSHGHTMLEVLVEVWMGQFSYEAAQPATMPQQQAQQMQAHQFFQSPALAAPYMSQADECTLPSRKLCIAFQTIVYHMLELSYVESPAGSAALNAVTATRASITQYQVEKYQKHSESPTVKLKVDWHLFGVLQHCFNRWAPEWSTNIGIAPVPIVPMSGATSSSSFAPAPARLDDRLTKLVELWLDYLEPWRSIYSEEFNPHIWRWWIVSNLPFYTILLRDFLRALVTLDLGREKTSARIVHLKTVLHVLALFSGPVLEQVQEIETLLFKNTATHHANSQHFAGASRADTSNQLLQQETFVVRNSLLHLSSLRPENYLPVFPASASYLSQQLPAKSAGHSLGLGPSFASPTHSRHATPSSPRDFASPTKSASTNGQTSTGGPVTLESQAIAAELVNMLSIGYSSPLDVAASKETALLDAPSYPPAVRPGEMPKPLTPSLLQQEEQAGQMIERRLCMMFALPGRQERRGEPTSPKNNNETSMNERDRARDLAPSRLDDLQPEYSLADQLLPARLTAAGRLQVKSGLKLCSKLDVPVLGREEDLPVCTYEYAMLVGYTRRATEWLQQSTGRKIDLRFAASQNFWIGVLVLVALIMLLRAVL